MTDADSFDRLQQAIVVSGAAMHEFYNNFSSLSSLYSQMQSDQYVTTRVPLNEGLTSWPDDGATLPRPFTNQVFPVSHRVSNSYCEEDTVRKMALASVVCSNIWTNATRGPLNIHIEIGFALVRRAEEQSDFPLTGSTVPEDAWAWLLLQTDPSLMYFTDNLGLGALDWLNPGPIGANPAQLLQVNSRLGPVIWTELLRRPGPQGVIAPADRPALVSTQDPVIVSAFMRLFFWLLWNATMAMMQQCGEKSAEIHRSLQRLLYRVGVEASMLVGLYGGVPLYQLHGQRLVAGVLNYGQAQAPAVGYFAVGEGVQFLISNFMPWFGVGASATSLYSLLLRASSYYQSGLVDRLRQWIFGLVLTLAYDQLYTTSSVIGSARILQIRTFFTAQYLLCPSLKRMVEAYNNIVADGCVAAPVLSDQLMIQLRSRDLKNIGLLEVLNVLFMTPGATGLTIGLPGVRSLLVDNVASRPTVIPFQLVVQWIQASDSGAIAVDLAALRNFVQGVNRLQGYAAMPFLRLFVQGAGQKLATAEDLDTLKQGTIVDDLLRELRGGGKVDTKDEGNLG